MPLLNDTDEVFRAALALPEESRAALAEELLGSLEDGTERREIDARWTREAEDRILAFERGEIRAISGPEVFAALRRPKQ
jgi:hypothetical protein